MNLTPLRNEHNTAEAVPGPDRVGPATFGARPSALSLHGTRASIVVLGILVLLSAGFNLAILMRVPTPFVDEGWNASRSWGLLTTGQAFGTLDAGVFNQYPVYTRYFPWLGTALHVPLLALLGPSLFAMRLASLLFGTILLLLVYLIGVRLYNRVAGLLSAALVSVSFPFVFSSHIARHDIMAAVFGLAAVALYLAGKSNRFPAADISAGLLASLVIDVHPNGLVYLPALGILYLIDALKPRFQFRSLLHAHRLWGFVAGVALGIVLFAVMHLLPNPQDYLTLYRISNGTSHTPPLLTEGPIAWAQSIADAFLLFGLPLALLTAVAVISLAKRRAAADKTLLILFAVLILAFSVVVRNKSIQYAILISPIACLVVGAYIEQLSRVGWRASRFVFGQYALAGGLVLAMIVGMLPALAADPAPEYETSLALIRNAVPQGAPVIGSQTYWFALPRQPYYSWEQIVFYRRLVPGASIEGSFQYLHPDYFIRDGWIDVFVTDDPARLSTSKDNTVLPRTELEDFLNNHAQLVDSIDTSAFGNVRVYKIDWASMSATTPQHSGAVAPPGLELP